MNNLYNPYKQYNTEKPKIYFLLNSSLLLNLFDSVFNLSPTLYNPRKQGLSERSKKTKLKSFLFLSKYFRIYFRNYTNSTTPTTSTLQRG